jgi:hypothetical protein
VLLCTLVVENESGLNQKGANTREAPTSQVPQVRAPMLQSAQLFTNSCSVEGGKASSGKHTGQPSWVVRSDRCFLDSPPPSFWVAGWSRSQPTG